MHNQHNKRKNVVARRPTETLTGLGGAGVVYGLLTQAGLDPVLAAIIAVIAGLVPGAISLITDRLSS